MTNQNLSEEEKEKIYNRIFDLRNQIYEIKDYISSDFCKKCSDMYTKMFVLEQELKGLQKKVMDDETNN
jgi:hypothetical protein